MIIRKYNPEEDPKTADMFGYSNLLQQSDNGYNYYQWHFYTLGSNLAIRLEFMFLSSTWNYWNIDRCDFECVVRFLKNSPSLTFSQFDQYAILSCSVIVLEDISIEEFKSLIQKTIRKLLKNKNVAFAFIK